MANLNGKEEEEEEEVIIFLRRGSNYFLARNPDYFLRSWQLRVRAAEGNGASRFQCTQNMRYQIMPDTGYGPVRFMRQGRTGGESHPTAIPSRPQPVYQLPVRSYHHPAPLRGSNSIRTRFHENCCIGQQRRSQASIPPLPSLEAEEHAAQAGAEPNAQCPGWQDEETEIDGE
eukprot:57805-Prymnesium_polylepis.1